MKRVSEQTYLRRLAKAITLAAWKHGAYYNGFKVTRASYRKGLVYATTVNGGQVLVVFEKKLEDGYGRTICASHFK